MAMTGGLAQWCGTAAGLDSCCWGTRPVPASLMAAGLPSPPASGSACEVGSRSASGTLLGGAPPRAAPRPTWEPSSTMAASRSQPVSPSTQAGLAGSCAVTSVSATAMSHVVLPGRAGLSRAVATGPMPREASTLDVCFPLPRVSTAALLPEVLSIPRLSSERRCGLTLSLSAWPHPVTLQQQEMLCEQQALGSCVCFLQLGLKTLGCQPPFAQILPRGGLYPLLAGR